jgi:hypothetical protein
LSQMLNGGEIHLSFPGPTLWRYRITARAGQPTIERAERTSLGWVASSTWAAVAAASVLECSLPLAELRPGAGHEVAFRVLIFEQGIETERHPDAAPIRIQPEEVTRDG